MTTAGPRPGTGSATGPSAGDQLVAGALVLVARVLEQVAPGNHVRPAAEQRTPLTLGHAAPHTELNPVVECVREALGPDGAAAADQLGPVLRRPLNEELVRVRSLARGAGGPVRDPHLAQLLLIVTPAPRASGSEPPGPLRAADSPAWQGRGGGQRTLIPC